MSYLLFSSFKQFPEKHYPASSLVDLKNIRQKSNAFRGFAVTLCFYCVLLVTCNCVKKQRKLCHLKIKYSLYQTYKLTPHIIEVFLCKCVALCSCSIFYIFFKKSINLAMSGAGWPISFQWKKLHFFLPDFLSCGMLDLDILLMSKVTVTGGLVLILPFKVVFVSLWVWLLVHRGQLTGHSGSSIGQILIQVSLKKKKKRVAHSLVADSDQYRSYRSNLL